MISAWLPIVATAFATASVLTVVGGLFARALHVRTIDALLLGPAVGFGIYLISGILATEIGYSYTWWGALTPVVIVALACLSHRRWRPREPTQLPAEPTVAPSRWEARASLAAVAAAALVVHAVLIRGMLSPATIPPGPDTVQGLGMALYLAERDSADFLRAGEYMWTLDVTYPGGFQALIATIFSWTHLSVIESAHAAILVMGGYILPCGVIALTRAVVGVRPLAAWGAALACVAFTVTPYFLLVAGPVWSDFASLALLPSLLALGSAAARARLPGLLRLTGVLVVVVIAVGGCQPSSLFIAAALLLPMALSSRGPVMVLGAAATLVVLGGWTFLGPSFMLEYGISGADSVRQGAMLALKNDQAPLAVRHLVFVPLLMLGLVSMAMHRRTVSITIGWVVLTVAWLSPALVSDELAARMLWPWWNSGDRVLAGLSIPSAIAVGAGCVKAVEITDRLLRGWASRRPVATVLAGIVGVVVGLATLSGLPASISIIRSGYQVEREAYTWITPKEFRSLGEIAATVEPGAVVAENPYRGGAYMYVTSGVQMLYPGRMEWQADGPALLSRSLVNMRSDAAVCQAIEQYSVDYVLVGGAPAEGVTEDGDFAGIDAVQGKAGFVKVASADPYTLYRVPSCSTG